MPLQQIQLDQSIYRKPQQSPVSQALRPQQGGFAAAGGTQPNRFVEEQRAQWAAEDKAKKAEREQQSAQLQNIGMQTIKQAQQQQQQVKQQQEQTKQQIESNPEPAAEEMWKFYLSLPEESQPMFLEQISKQTGGGSTVSSGGRTVQVGGAKYNPIFNNWLEKGYVMFDPQGKIVVNKPEEIKEEEWYVSGNLMYNRRTGESKTIEGVGEQRATSMKEMGDYKQKALDADTYEESQSIVKEYNKYSEAIPIGVSKKDWINNQKSYFDSVKSSIDTLVDEKGWLQKGTKTSEEVGLDFEGEEQVGVIYVKLQKEYMKYRDMLEKEGEDVSSYPKIKPIGEIEKVTALTWGKVTKGDYKSIYE